MKHIIDMCFCCPPVMPGGGRSLSPSLFPPVPSSEVDVSVYILFFYFYIFFTVPFPQHLAKMDD